MARGAAATEVATPETPPKRVTRARLRNASALATKDEPKGALTTTNTTTSTTTKKRRPRMKQAAVMSTVEAKTKQSALGAPAKKNTKSTKLKAKKHDCEDGDNSSEDEMNFVPMRVMASTRSVTRRMVTPTSSLASTTSELGCRVPRTSRKEPETAMEDSLEKKNGANDDDELADLQPVKHKPARVTSTTAKKPKTPSISKITKGSGRIGASNANRSSTTESTTPAISSKTRNGLVKKKVTFLDITEDSDKENHPLRAASKGKNKLGTGLTAKPIQNRAAANATETSSGANDIKLEQKKKPLFPKKATQVAKSGSSGSSDENDDDVFGARTATISPLRSPVKAASVPPSFASPAKKIDFMHMARPTSQGSAGEKGTVTSEANAKGLSPITGLSSPARRPLKSASSSAFKESPRKTPIPFNEQLFHAEATTQTKVSPLKCSPKKGPGLLLMQPSLSEPLSPTKSKISPLKSPARRPPAPVTMLTPLLVIRKSPTHDCASRIQGHAHFQPRSDSSDIHVGNPTVEENQVDQIVTQEMEILDISEFQDDPFMEQVATPSRRETMLRYDSMTVVSSVESLRSFTGTPPPAPTPPVFDAKAQTVFNYRNDMIYEDSDVEFDDSPTKNQRQPESSSNNDIESPEMEYKLPGRLDTDVGFTPLADRLSQWVTGSPEKERTRCRPRDIFGTKELPEDRPEPRRSLRMRPDSLRKPVNSIFEDEVPAIEDLHIHTDQSASLADETAANSIAYDEIDDGALQRAHADSSGQGSDCTEVYGDENTPPSGSTTIKTALSEECDGDNAASTRPTDSICLPMSVTPIRQNIDHRRTVHTMAKVPLKGESDGSLKVPRKRTRSLSFIETSPTPTLSRSHTLPSPRVNRTPLKTYAPAPSQDDDPSGDFLLPERPKPGTWSGRISPIKSRNLVNAMSDDSGVLQGAVVFVDVHTAEGADASGIFIELLSQMGARCVKAWKWNPRMSLSPVDGVEPRDTPKVGITHVVHKDGGVRTLQKVREANGVVKCVGVGWVLDCERENRWVDEANYAVDISMIPRGGNKRRKSMEPRALSNQNGTLAPLEASTSSSCSRRSGANAETLQELRRLSPIPQLRPSKRDSRQHPRGDSIDPAIFERHNFEDSDVATDTSQPSSPKQKPSFEAGEPQTPIRELSYIYDLDGANAPSPTTPYYLSEGAKLIQHTCPPKQSRQGLFPISGNIDEQKDEKLRIRLEAARRKSLVWKPRVGSPLGKRYIQ